LIRTALTRKQGSRRPPRRWARWRPSNGPPPICATLALPLARIPLRIGARGSKAFGVLTAMDLKTAPNGRRVRCGSLCIVRQRPGSAKGFLFLSLEDEAGVSNVIIEPDVYDANRGTILAATCSPSKADWSEATSHQCESRSILASLGSRRRGKKPRFPLTSRVSAPQFGHADTAARLIEVRNVEETKRRSRPSTKLSQWRW
jgi:DNA polymerase III alpha subunit